ncbi:ROK family protein [Minwuia thermotolerans]|uniref:Fructokinase n=1 Tax=Minwuia thermotolerans TaxID=2056226 RepID=A0A2M9G2Y3_9PROT|nr:ROK family protein [Minwuia thermotolerans]PJK30060.1 hypothetical protein CVT23_09880 [Minwuia thermotolerans]
MRIGIDLGGTKIEALAIDDRGREMYRQRVPAPRDDYHATIDAILGLVAELEERTGRRGRVGVGTPGAVSPVTGLMKNCNSTWLNGQPLARDLEAALRRPVRLANDANCFALSEAIDGAAAGAPTVFGVILGTGVGAGLVIDRKTLTGPNAIAGEWGHNPLPWPRDDERPGPACWCGKRGCIETFLSGPAVERLHLDKTGRRVPAREIADSGIWADYVDRLARALAHVINIIDPDMIVLGGGISNRVELYQPVADRLNDHVFSDYVSTVISQPVFGDASGVRGAAWLWPTS